MLEKEFRFEEIIFKISEFKHLNWKKRIIYTLLSKLAKKLVVVQYIFIAKKY